MATPVTLKKIEEKKQAAQKKRDRLTQQGQLLPLSTMLNAPSSHLLVREEPNPMPRMIDLVPLSGPNYTNFRERKEDFASDRPIGFPNYTSFEGGGGKGGRPGQQKKESSGNGTGGHFPKRSPPPAKLKAQATVALPAGMATVQYTLKSNNLVCFHGKNHFLSSLYPVRIMIDGHEYPSIEHYYQACKIFSLLGPDQAQMLRFEADPLRAKIRAKEILQSWQVPNDKVEQWKDNQGVLVLAHGMQHKFNQVGNLHEKLLATGDAILAQAYDRDSFYAVGMNEQQLREWARQHEGEVLKFPAEVNYESVKYLPLLGKGKNVLGVICMQVRHKLRELESAASRAGKDNKPAVVAEAQKQQAASPPVGEEEELLSSSSSSSAASSSTESGDSSGESGSEENAADELAQKLAATNFKEEVVKEEEEEKGKSGENKSKGKGKKK